MRHVAQNQIESRPTVAAVSVAHIVMNTLQNTNGQAQSVALINTVEQLANIGTRAVRIDCSKMLVIGKQANGRAGDLKLSAAADDAPAWLGNVCKVWGMVGIMNADYTAAVRRYLVTVGNADATTWEAGANWHTKTEGSKTRAIRSHQDAEQDVNLALIAWYTDGNLYTEYRHGHQHGPALSVHEVDALRAHMYARKASTPSVNTSTGRVAVPFAYKVVKLANVATITGLPDMLADDAATIKGVQHMPALVQQLGAIATGQNINVQGPRHAHTEPQA